MNSHVDAASHNHTRYVASANTFDKYYDQGPFDSSSNIQHINPYSSAVSSQYVVSPQDKLMDERIGYDDVHYLANYSPNSAPYSNAPIHDSASYVTTNSSRINKNSARCANGNIHNSASYVTTNSSRINEISARHSGVKTSYSASFDLKTSRINEELAHARNPHGSSKWKVPAYHRPYPLAIDYLRTPEGWLVPKFYKFSGENDKTDVVHIRIYLFTARCCR